MSDPLVQVEKLEKHFVSSGRFLNRVETVVRAVDGISFTIERGETYALVGESGSGKTTVGKSLLRIHEPSGGKILFDGTDVTSLEGAALKQFRQNAQMVFQDPASSLNPRKPVKQIVQQPLDIHSIGSKAERREKVEWVLEKVDLPREFLNRYPSALSGGQKQRVGIARALVTDPEFLVLDEPTSALDVSVQAKIIDLLDALQAEMGLTYLFISHDLSLMENISDRIGVMYLGEIVETARTDQLFAQPSHPYTRGLLRSIPSVQESTGILQRLQSDEPPSGEIPDPTDVPSGCSFRTRCPRAESKCKEIDPGLIHRDGLATNHEAACHFPETESS